MPTTGVTPTGFGQRSLAAIERLGNRLPDPAVLFIALLFMVWLLSWLLSYGDWGVADPRSGEPLRIVNQLSAQSMVAFFASMVARELDATMGRNLGRETSGAGPSQRDSGSIRQCIVGITWQPGTTI